jgi:hypothetical protein
MSKQSAASMLTEGPLTNDEYSFLIVDIQPITTFDAVVAQR